MVEQYPDSIIVTVSTPAVQDESSGNFTPGSEVTYTWECRAEVNGSERKVADSEGTLLDYAFDIYLPLMETVVPFGSPYQLTRGGAHYSGTIKGASNGQLNSRLWA